jgi:hypothetical protein
MSRGSIVLTLLVLLFAVVPAAASSDLERQMKAVESIRGLAFREPVRAVTIDRAELPERLRSQLTRTLPYSIEEWAAILEALLLIEPDPGDPFDRLIDLYEAQVLAYYDPDTGTYYALREPPPALKNLPGGLASADGVIVHELMHALQDQHHAIGRRALELRKDTDASLAYHAVLEGEATLVMLAYLIDQSGADFDTLVRQPMFDGLLASAATADMMVDPSTPRYFAESLKFPYLQGLSFVIHAYRRGGWKEIDRVHADPPQSTRELLHPSDYFDRRFKPRKFVAEPPFPTPTISVEHLGEFHWGFLAGSENARGWTADRVTIAHDTACAPTVLVETSWESEEAAQRFASGYAAFLDRKDIGFLSRQEGRDVRVAYGADRELMERFLR